jgi:tubulin epsilon
VNKNISKQKKNLKIIGWNHEGFKIGLCDQPPVNMKYGLLALSNNTAVADIFQRMTNRFLKLYKVKAHTHHYTEYLDISEFDRAISNVQILINEYNQISIPKYENSTFRIKPIV